MSGYAIFPGAVGEEVSAHSVRAADDVPPGAFFSATYTTGDRLLSPGVLRPETAQERAQRETLPGRISTRVAADPVLSALVQWLEQREGLPPGTILSEIDP